MDAVAGVNGAHFPAYLHVALGSYVARVRALDGAQRRAVAAVMVGEEYARAASDGHVAHWFDAFCREVEQAARICYEVDKAKAPGGVAGRGTVTEEVT